MVGPGHVPSHILVICLIFSSLNFFTWAKKCLDTRCLEPISLAYATQDYDTTDANYISFKKGDQILIFSKDGSVWEGNVRGTAGGFFHSDYVKETRHFVKDDQLIELNMEQQHSDSQSNNQDDKIMKENGKPEREYDPAAINIKTNEKIDDHEEVEKNNYIVNTIKQRIVDIEERDDSSSKDISEGDTIKQIFVDIEERDDSSSKDISEGDTIKQRTVDIEERDDSSSKDISEGDTIKQRTVDIEERDDSSSKDISESHSDHEHDKEHEGQESEGENEEYKIDRNTQHYLKEADSSKDASESHSGHDQDEEREGQESEEENLVKERKTATNARQSPEDIDGPKDISESSLKDNFERREAERRSSPDEHELDASEQSVDSQSVDQGENEGEQPKKEMSPSKTDGGLHEAHDALKDPRESAGSEATDSKHSDDNGDVHAKKDIDLTEGDKPKDKTDDHKAPISENQETPNLDKESEVEEVPDDGKTASEKVQKEGFFGSMKNLLTDFTEDVLNDLQGDKAEEQSKDPVPAHVESADRDTTFVNTPENRDEIGKRTEMPSNGNAQATEKELPAVENLKLLNKKDDAEGKPFIGGSLGEKIRQIKAQHRQILKEKAKEATKSFTAEVDLDDIMKEEAKRTVSEIPGLMREQKSTEHKPEPEIKIGDRLSLPNIDESLFKEAGTSEETAEKDSAGVEKVVNDEKGKEIDNDFNVKTYSHKVLCGSVKIEERETCLENDDRYRCAQENCCFDETAEEGEKCFFKPSTPESDNVKEDSSTEAQDEKPDENKDNIEERTNHNELNQETHDSNKQQHEKNSDSETLDPKPASKPSQSLNQDKEKADNILDNLSKPPIDSESDTILNKVVDEVKVPDSTEQSKDNDEGTDYNTPDYNTDNNSTGISDRTSNDKDILDEDSGYTRTGRNTNDNPSIKDTPLEKPTIEIIDYIEKVIVSDEENQKSVDDVGEEIVTERESPRGGDDDVKHRVPEKETADDELKTDNVSSTQENISNENAADVKSHVYPETKEEIKPKTVDQEDDKSEEEENLAKNETIVDNDESRKDKKENYIEKNTVQHLKDEIAKELPATETAVHSDPVGAETVPETKVQNATVPDDSIDESSKDKKEEKNLYNIEPLKQNTVQHPKDEIAKELPATETAVHSNPVDAERVPETKVQNATVPEDPMGSTSFHTKTDTVVKMKSTLDEKPKEKPDAGNQNILPSKAEFSTSSTEAPSTVATDKTFEKKHQGFPSKWTKNKLMESQARLQAEKYSKGSDKKDDFVTSDNAVKPSEQDQTSTSKDVDDVKSKVVDEATSKVVHEATSKDVDEATSKDVDEATSKVVDEATSKVVDEATSKDVDEATSKDVDEATSKDVDEAGESTAQSPGTCTKEGQCEKTSSMFYTKVPESVDEKNDRLGNEVKSPEEVKVVEDGTTEDEEQEEKEEKEDEIKDDKNQTLWTLATAVRTFRVYHTKAAVYGLVLLKPVKNIAKALGEQLGLSEVVEQLESEMRQGPQGAVALTVIMIVFAMYFVLSVLCRKKVPPSYGPNLKDVFKTYEGRIKILEEECSSYEQEITEVTTKASEDVGRSCALDKELQDERHERRKSDDQISILKQIVKNLNEKVDLLEEESSKLKQSLEEKNIRFKDFEEELAAKAEESEATNGKVKELEKSLEEKEKEKDDLKKDINDYKEQLGQAWDDTHRHKNMLQDWNDRYLELQQKYDDVLVSKQSIEEQARFKDNEIEVLRESLVQIYKDVHINSDEELSEEELKEERERKIKELMNVSQVRTDYKLCKEEKENLEDNIKQEVNRREKLEGDVEQLESDLAKSKASEEEIKFKYREAEIKLNALQDYFKNMENDLHRKLTAEEAARLASESELERKLREASTAVQDVELYRKQVDELRKEINETQVAFRSQVTATEERAHENWLKFRSAERELEEFKRERDALRRRLYDLETNAKPSSEVALPLGSIPAEKFESPTARSESPSSVRSKRKTTNPRSKSPSNVSPLDERKERTRHKTRDRNSPPSWEPDLGAQQRRRGGGRDKASTPPDMGPPPRRREKERDTPPSPPPPWEPGVGPPPRRRGQRESPVAPPSTFDLENERRRRDGHSPSPPPSLPRRRRRDRMSPSSPPPPPPPNILPPRGVAPHGTIPQGSEYRSPHTTRDGPGVNAQPAPPSFAGNGPYTRPPRTTQSLTNGPSNQFVPIKPAPRR